MAVKSLRALSYCFAVGPACFQEVLAPLPWDNFPWETTERALTGIQAFSVLGSVYNADEADPLNEKLTPTI